MFKMVKKRQTIIAYGRDYSDLRKSPSHASFSPVSNGRLADAREKLLLVLYGYLFKGAITCR